MSIAVVHLLLVAPPGAGKGTQARRLAAHYNATHISSGELLRREISEKTELGQLATQYVTRGDLVPDDVVVRVVAGAVFEAAQRGGYVLDGFPRNLHQAEAAFELASQVEGVLLQAVVHLSVSRPELRRRLTARAEQEGRRDDTAATIERRLQVYDQETEPLLEYYASRRLLINVNGEQPVEQVFSDIVAAVDAHTRQSNT